MLNKGQASALMTKLVNDSTGYTAAFAALIMIAYKLEKNGQHGTSLVMALIGGISGLVMFFYWIGHVFNQCEKLRDSTPSSKAAKAHASLILFIFTTAYPGIVAITILSFYQSVR